MPPQLNRLFLIFGFIVLAFVAMRWIAQPESFGEYGHYRGDALAEATVREPAYVPRNACAECHEDEANLHSAGPHKNVSCQICHGAAVDHVEDPTTKNIKRPDIRALCLRCHEQLEARPAKFPQIDEKEHADGEACNTCHVVHNPAEMIE